MRITVMGAGGVGGYFGARVAAAGNDVTFIARGAHLAAIEKNGLRFDSKIGPLLVKPVKAVADTSAIAAADSIIFAVKMGDTDRAAETLKPLVDKGASVFTFQNGVESASRLGQALGPHAIVPGAARIAAYVSEPGVVKESGGFAVLEFGEADGRPSGRVRAFHAVCERAGIVAHIRDDIHRTIWMKFALLAPLAALTTLTRGPIGPVRAHPDSRALLLAAVREVVSVGVALNAGLKPEDAETVIAQIDKLPDAMMSSMSNDLLAGKPLELSGLSGAVSRLGAECGVPTPAHTFVVQALAPFATGT
jgi:2-dehydropantoate 2-reductase